MKKLNYMIILFLFIILTIGIFSKVNEGMTVNPLNKLFRNFGKPGEDTCKLNVNKENCLNDPLKCGYLTYQDDNSGVCVLHDDDTNGPKYMPEDAESRGVLYEIRTGDRRIETTNLSNNYQNSGFFKKIANIFKPGNSKRFKTGECDFNFLIHPDKARDLGSLERYFVMTSYVSSSQSKPCDTSGAWWFHKTLHPDLHKRPGCDEGMKFFNKYKSGHDGFDKWTREHCPIGGRFNLDANNPAACRNLCDTYEDCAYFNSFPNGGCHLQPEGSESSTKFISNNPTKGSGPKGCKFQDELDTEMSNDISRKPTKAHIYTLREGTAIDIENDCYIIKGKDMPISSYSWNFTFKNDDNKTVDGLHIYTKKLMDTREVLSKLNLYGIPKIGKDFHSPTVPCDTSGVWYRIEGNTNFPGEGSYQGSVSSASECQKLCKESDNCSFYNYFGDNKHCYLQPSDAKQYDPASKPRANGVNTDHRTTHSGSQNCTIPNKPCDTSGAWYRSDGNGAFPGPGQLGVRTVATPEECRQRCIDTEDCAYFNNFSNGGCHIQPKTAKKLDLNSSWSKTNRTVLSGTKNCIMKN